MTLKTLTIVGHTITLEAGQRYLASRPIAQVGIETYPISIYKLFQPHWESPVVFIDNLTYDQANDLLAEFNNSEETSLLGRVW